MTNKVYRFTNGLGASVPIVVYTPNNMDSSKKDYPVVIFLSGSGEFSDDPNIVKVQNNSNHANLLKFGDLRGFIVVAPQFVPSQNYIIKDKFPVQTWHPNFQDGFYMRDVINWVKSNLPINTKRIYLTGLSAGGNGTWDTIIKWEELTNEIAAAVPLCAGYQDGDWTLPVKSKVPIWAFHGLKDVNTSPNSTIQQVNKLNNELDINPKARITLYPTMDHYIWSTVYNTPELYDWMLSQTNDGTTIPEEPPVKQVKDKLSSSVVLNGIRVDFTITTYSDGSSTVEKIN